MADRFDLDAIEADDALLDLLAAGGESARAAGEHDLAVALLADLRLAVEVEDELPVETIDDPESFLARCAALNPITDPFARKMATRGLALGVAAVAALSVSGVAAAVNGDPLSPYEKVIEKMVDAVRPQTSFPKEDLDGLPVMDKTKIVKVGKDYKKQVQAEHAAQAAGKDNPLIDVDPNSRDLKVSPPMVVQEKPLAIQIQRPTTPIPVKTEDPDNVSTDKPTDTKTEPPTDTTGDGTDGDGTTDTTTTPTPPPSTPTDTPTSTPTDPPSTPTDTPSQPANVDTGTGDSTGTPTTTPTGDTGQTDGSGADGSGASGTSGSDTSGSDTSTPAVPSGDEQKPGDEGTQVPDVQGEVADLLDKVLPTPTGEPITIESAQVFFGESQAAKPPTAKKATKKAAATKAAGKHSSGSVTTGSVRKAYPKGKHSTGLYPEGKHAAIERTHGSTADADVLAILQVVNAPVNK